MSGALSVALLDFGSIPKEGDGNAPDEQTKCGKCDLEIESTGVKLRGTNYHQSCFTCESCANPLDRNSIHKFSGLLYCADCVATQIERAHDKQSCSACAKQFHSDETFLQLGSKRAVKRGKLPECSRVFFHVNCLKCFQCSEVIDYVSTFFDKNEQFYCKSCYTTSFTTQCFACKTPISDCPITAEDRTYHGNCFRCSEKSCGKKLTGLFQTQNTLHYCIECFYFYFAKKCSKCTTAINLDPETGLSTYVSFNKKFYHPTCFRCEQPKCDAIIDNSLFSLVDRKVTCQNCAKQFVLTLQNNATGANQAKNDT